MMYPLETEERYEMWGGEKLMMTPSNTDHGFVSSNLTILVGSYVKKRQLGKLFDSEVPIYLHGDLTRKDFRLADLSFVSTDRLDIVQYKGIYGAPDLAVEILSPGKTNIERDRIEKFELYQQFGVKEYWIVTPWEEQIELYGHNGNKLTKLEHSGLFPGIELKNEDIFE